MNKKGKEKRKEAAIEAKKSNEEKKPAFNDFLKNKSSEDLKGIRHEQAKKHGKLKELTAKKRKVDVKQRPEQS